MQTSESGIKALQFPRPGLPTAGFQAKKSDSFRSWVSIIDQQVSVLRKELLDVHTIYMCKEDLRRHMPEPDAIRSYSRLLWGAGWESRRDERRGAGCWCARNRHAVVDVWLYSSISNSLTLFLQKILSAWIMHLYVRTIAPNNWVPRNKIIGGKGSKNVGNKIKSIALFTQIPR